MPAGDEDQYGTSLRTFFKFRKSSAGFLSGGSESSLNVIGGVEPLGLGFDWGFGVLLLLSTGCPTFFIDNTFKMIKVFLDVHDFSFLKIINS